MAEHGPYRQCYFTTIGNEDRLNWAGINRAGSSYSTGIVAAAMST